MYIKSNDLFSQSRPESLYDSIPRPIVIADNLLTPDNMGSMIRLADNIGAAEMIFLGADDESHIGRELSLVDVGGVRCSLDCDDFFVCGNEFP